MRIKTLIPAGAAACVLALGLGACSTHSQRQAASGAAIGAVAGAAIGAVSGDVDPVEGAAAGAAVGGAAGAVKGCREDRTC